MRCPRCGKVVANGLAACPNCGMPTGNPSVGQSVALPAAAPVLSQAFSNQRRKNAQTTAVIVAMLVLAVLAVIATGGLRALGFGAANDHAVAMNSRAKPPTPILSATSAAPPPVLEKTVQRPPGMPQDVFDWLEHLRKTEEARVDLTTTQLSKAMSEYAKSQVFGGVDSIKDLLNGIDDPNEEVKSPTDELYPVLKELHDQSKDLIAKFESYPPPPECQPIHDAYYDALSETTGMLGDISDNLKAGDVDKLLKMKGTSPENIDANANKADRLVGEICDKYNTRRWFYIQGDIGSGGMLGMPKL